MHLAAGYTPSVRLASEINDALYKWFVLARSKNIPVGGPQLIEKAKMIAATLGKPEFKGSQGWLEKWKKRFAIKQLKICSESGEVQGETHRRRKQS